jgi:hypothetical protein
MSSFDSKLITSNPVPVWLFTFRGDDDLRYSKFDWVQALGSIDRNLLKCLYRGVSFDRLQTVLQNGIDVEPTNSVIHADGFTKACEYGSWPKLILALDREPLNLTYVEIEASTPKSEVERLRTMYPTMLKSEDGSRFWCSRLREDDPRVSSPYEVAYARWIPGDPFDALRAALAFTRADDEIPSILKEIREAEGVEAC